MTDLSQSGDWEDAKAAIAHRSATGSNVKIAMTIYDAAISDGGRFTVTQLVEDWKLSENDTIYLLHKVREGWREGRWSDWRSGPRDRRAS